MQLKKLTFNKEEKPWEKYKNIFLAKFENFNE